MTCYFNVIIGVVFFDWGNYFRYFFKSIITLFWISFDPVWRIIKLGFFRTESRTQSMKSSVVALGWLLTFTGLFTRNLSPIYILDHRIAYNRNLFLYRWAICRLSFNQVTIIVVSMCCCFIVLFTRGGLCIGFVVGVRINSMIIRVGISYIMFLPLRTLDWVSWITRQHW